VLKNRAFSVYSNLTLKSPDNDLDYRVLALASAVLSVWLIAIDPTVNSDAIIYLRTAEAYLQDGFFASQSMFDRPLMAISFALIHKLTGMPLLYAAHLLNGLFYMVLSIAFVSTVRVLGGDRRIQFFAAIVILSHPLLNGYRSAIVRDPAYWALIMLAYRELLLYTREPGLKHQVTWFAYVSLATLFRFEGLFFAALAPLVLLVTGYPGTRLRSCLRLLALPMIAITALLLAIMSYELVLSPGTRLFPAIENYIQALLAFPAKFDQLSMATGMALLEFSAREDAAVATWAGLIAILLLNICRAITWPYVFVLLWGWKRKLLDRISPSDGKLLRAHLLICLLYLALFTITNRFMLERYCSMFTLFLLLYLPFIFNALWPRGKRSWRGTVIFLLLLGTTLDVLHNNSYKKWFIKDATDWIVTNTPDDVSLITNHMHIAYFSKREFDWKNYRNANLQLADMESTPQLWRDYDYIAMSVRSSEIEQWRRFLALYSLTERIVFKGQGRDDIRIVELPHHEGR
jgi:hypothetical protein